MFLFDINQDFRVIPSFRTHFAGKCDSQSRDLTQLPCGYINSRLNLVHHVGCTVERMWSRNIQNGFEKCSASLGFESYTFDVESNRLKKSYSKVVLGKLKVSPCVIYSVGP